jgi:hypothetical protein
MQNGQTSQDETLVRIEQNARADATKLPGARQTQDVNPGAPLEHLPHHN